MKAMFGLFVLVVIVLGGVLMFGGLSGMDPAEQAQEFKNLCKPGTPWTTVVAERPPKKYYAIDISRSSGRTQELDYDEGIVKDAVTKGHYAQGFVFEYFFSNEHAYAVSFDGKGNVSGVRKMKTMSDLVQGNLFTPSE